MCITSILLNSLTIVQAATQVNSSYKLINNGVKNTADLTCIIYMHTYKWFMWTVLYTYYACRVMAVEQYCYVLCYILSQIAYAAALTSLADRSRFKNFFRTTPGFDKYAPGLLGLFNEMGWQKIAFLTQNENVFVEVIYYLLFVH